MIAGGGHGLTGRRLMHGSSWVRLGFGVLAFVLEDSVPQGEDVFLFLPWSLFGFEVTLR